LSAGGAGPGKVVEINLEAGGPTVETALLNLVNRLGTIKRQGAKAAILIHGYGSTGTGGAIRAAVRSRLGDNSLRGLVRQFAGGEDWHAKKRELLGLCGSLGAHERRIAGNEGVTVVVLK
jgi:hypothetical protein